MSERFRAGVVGCGEVPNGANVLGAERGSHLGRSFANPLADSGDGLPRLVALALGHLSSGQQLV